MTKGIGARARPSSSARRDELRVAEAGPAPPFRDDRPEPAHLRRPRPELAAHQSVGLEDRAGEPEGGAVLEVVARGGPEELLLLREVEVHRGSRPGRRFPPFRRSGGSPASRDAPRTLRATRRDAAGPRATRRRATGSRGSRPRNRPRWCRCPPCRRSPPPRPRGRRGRAGTSSAGLRSSPSTGAPRGEGRSRSGRGSPRRGARPRAPGGEARSSAPAPPRGTGAGRRAGCRGTRR